MPDWLVRLFTALVPPFPGASTDEAVYRWRVTVSVLLIGTIMSEAVHIAIACGWLAFMGMPGFVQAKDLDGVKDSVTAVRVASTNAIGEVKAELVAINANQRHNTIRQIDTAIQADVARMCRAQTDDAKQYFTDRVHSELLEWADQTSQAYPMPSCGQLLTKSQ